MPNEHSLPRPLVLVVDDDTVMRLLAREALEEAGFDVEEADDGLSALESFKQSQPAIVLLDVMMPGMDGFSACKLIRTLPGGEHTPVLMMTGLDDVDSINRAYEVGATDFATKPINYLILGHRVRYMLRSRQTLDDLRSSEKRLANAQRIARLGHWELDVTSNSVNLSAELCRIFGISPVMRRCNLEAFAHFIHPEDRKIFVDSINQAIGEKKSFSTEHRVLLPDKSERIIHQDAEFTGNGGGGYLMLTGTAQDITDRIKAERKIFQLAYYDELTGLPNRTYFKEHLNRIIAQAKRYRRQFEILTLDIDNFKRINDTLGHTAGDVLLKQVAKRLQSYLRASDFTTRGTTADSSNKIAYQGEETLARLDGDEFSILLTEVRRAENAAFVAQRLKDVLSEPFELKGDRVFITASIGIIVYPTDGDDTDTLLKNADVALHHAKDRGKNNYQFYTESLNASAFERLLLENSLHGALERREFQLYYQPKVDIATGQTASMEALIRWQHPKLGIISPEKFIPVAEDTGLIVSLGEWVLRTASAQAKAWQHKGVLPMPMAINVSARQFKEGRLADTIERILVETGLEPRFLEVELTEGTLMEDTEISTVVLAELKAMGINIALDDFGTGYSSMSYLKRFPIDTLKIDKSFVQDTTIDNDSAAIVKAIIALAQNLRLRVVAEGVETKEQLNFLREHGCDEVQGYYFSAPLESTRR